jgi:hypothetical protein
VRDRKMVGPIRPQFVLFGSSIFQLSFLKEGWGAILSHLYSRKVYYFSSFLILMLSVTQTFFFYDFIFPD